LKTLSRGREKKLKNQEKLKKLIKKTNCEKKSIKILKKLAGSVRFRFYKPKIKKTNRTQTEKNWKKPSQTEKNRAKTESNRKNRVKLKKSSQTGLNWFLS
jgi:hypothetical protein